MMQRQATTSTTPAKLKRAAPSLPAALAHLRNTQRWVLWKYSSETNGKGKRRKTPFSAHPQPSATKLGKHTYKGAKTTDATTWATFDDCLAAMYDWRGWFDGIGLVLLDGEVGIDFDDCYVKDGTLRADVAQFVTLAAGHAYIERSVSGQGVHIIVLGETLAPVHTDAGEVYAGGTGRFFTLSGDELPNSSTPNAAQPFIDSIVAYLTQQRPASNTITTPVSLQPPPVVALTPEQAAAERTAREQLDALRGDLRANMTPQLRNLLEHNIFPPHMTDRSESGARSVVVAQLQRARNKHGVYRNYTDAEVFVLTRDLWKRHGYEGAMHGNDGRLNADARRMMAKYRPQRRPNASAATIPTKRTYQTAPSPLAYLQRLAAARVGDSIPLNRAERAKLGGVCEPTAKRLETALSLQGLANAETYTMRGKGAKGRSSLLRLTPVGLGTLANDPMIFGTNAEAAANDPMKDTATACGKTKTAVPKNTVLCDRQADAAPQPHTHTHNRVPSARSAAYPPFPASALWRAADVDMLVTVTGVLGDYDGRVYYAVAESTTGIPADEVEWIISAPESVPAPRPVLSLLVREVFDAYPGVTITLKRFKGYVAMNADGDTWTDTALKSALAGERTRRQRLAGRSYWDALNAEIAGLRDMAPSKLEDLHKRLSRSVGAAAKLDAERQAGTAKPDAKMPKGLQRARVLMPHVVKELARCDAIDATRIAQHGYRADEVQAMLDLAAQVLAKQQPPVKAAQVRVNAPKSATVADMPAYDVCGLVERLKARLVNAG